MSFFAEAAQALNAAWEKPVPVATSIPHNIVEAVTIVLKEGGQTYPFALVTQVLGPLVCTEYDPLSIQKRSQESHSISAAASWDGRSLAHRVVVPWNQAVEFPLGSSNEPYLNKPLRFTYFDDAMRASQKYKDKYDALLSVLKFCAQNPLARSELLDVIVTAAKNRLGSSIIEFAPPLRMDAPRLKKLIDNFLDAKSGGLRLQIVTCALFRAATKDSPNIRVTTDKPTVADAVSQSGADIRIIFGDRLKMLVKVKDRQLTASDITSSIRKARKVSANELKIIVADGTELDDELMALASREFSNGMTVSLITWKDLLAGFFAVSDAESRTFLVRSVGDLLNEIAASQEHKLKWRDLLLSE
jgi:hypothetical protein